jgi:acylphosphatase
MPRRRWVVYGGVQGVGFRFFVREQARRDDLAGQVANRADGTVEVEAAGPAEALERLLAALRRGPAGATVSEVAEEPPGTASLARPFRIER